MHALSLVQSALAALSATRVRSSRNALLPGFLSSLDPHESGTPSLLSLSLFYPSRAAELLTQRPYALLHPTHRLVMKGSESGSESTSNGATRRPATLESSLSLSLCLSLPVSPWIFSLSRERESEGA